MKILWLTKRQYMRKDLLDDRYWRLYELPLGLAKLGHQVHAICLSYQAKGEVQREDWQDPKGGCLKWSSLDAGLFKTLGALKYWNHLNKICLEDRPDLIVAASDSVFCIMGHWLSRKFSCPCIFDIYDNFEAFAACRIPGIRYLYRSAVRRVEGVTVFSQTLLDKITLEYGRALPSLFLESGIDREVFKPLDKESCRKRLGLDLKDPLIGAYGTLDNSRNFSMLLEVFFELRKKIPNLGLILAGKLQDDVNLKDFPGAIFLGELPHFEIPSLINCLDVSVVCYKDSRNGKYSYPTRAYEALACKVPLVAARLGDLDRLFQGCRQILFDWDSKCELMNAIENQLSNPKLPDFSVKSWESVALEMNHFICGLLKNAPL